MKKTRGRARMHAVMTEVTDKDFRDFARKHKEVTVECATIKIGERKKIESYQPDQFAPERTNAWSFPERGRWATHQGDYRGNWPPQMARNIILRYSKSGETVLDQMCGSGTTLIECKLLGRNVIGVDINRDSTMVTRDRLDFDYHPPDSDFSKVSAKTYVGDARNLNLIQNDRIDLVATHPPYANIIAYSGKKANVQGDLSLARSLQGYLDGMKEVARESYRVLRPGRMCAILVGDTRKHRHHVPIAFRVMEVFLEAGFILREDVMKYQWKTKTTREKWQGLSKVAEECWVDVDRREKKGRYTDFLLLSHEHLFIFRKPETGEDTSKLEGSLKL